MDIMSLKLQFETLINSISEKINSGAISDEISIVKDRMFGYRHIRLLIRLDDFDIDKFILAVEKLRPEFEKYKQLRKIEIDLNTQNLTSKILADNKIDDPNIHF